MTTSWKRAMDLTPGDIVKAGTSVKHQVVVSVQVIGAYAVVECRGGITLRPAKRQMFRVVGTVAA